MCALLPNVRWIILACMYILKRINILDVPPLKFSNQSCNISLLSIKHWNFGLYCKFFELVLKTLLWINSIRLTANQCFQLITKKLCKVQKYACVILFWKVYDQWLLFDQKNWMIINLFKHLCKIKIKKQKIVNRQYVSWSHFLCRICCGMSSNNLSDIFFGVIWT